MTDSEKVTYDPSEVKIITPSLYSCDCNSGAWQPTHVYNSCHVLHSYDHELQLSQPAFDKQNQWGKLD